MSAVTSRLDQISSLLLGIVSGTNPSDSADRLSGLQSMPPPAGARGTFLSCLHVFGGRILTHLGHIDHQGSRHLPPAESSSQWWSLTQHRHPGFSESQPLSSTAARPPHLWSNQPAHSPISSNRAGSHGIAHDHLFSQSNPNDQRLIDQEVLMQGMVKTNDHLESDNTNSDEDDPLLSTVRQEPFKMMTNREEHARLREEGHASLEQGSHHNRTPSDILEDSSRASKRQKTTPGGTSYDRRDLVQKKGDTSGAFLNPVQLGFCTEERGRQMFQL